MENIKKLLLDKKTPALIKMITITTLIQESQKKNNLISNTKKTISLYPITKAIPFIFDSGLSKKYIKKILKRAKKMNRKKFALKFINSNYIKGLLLGIKKNQLQLPPEIAEKIISFSNGDFNFQKFKPLTFNRKKYYTKNYCF